MMSHNNHYHHSHPQQNRKKLSLSFLYQIDWNLWKISWWTPRSRYKLWATWISWCRWSCSRWKQSWPTWDKVERWLWLQPVRQQLRLMTWAHQVLCRQTFPLWGQTLAACIRICKPYSQWWAEIAASTIITVLHYHHLIKFQDHFLLQQIFKALPVLIKIVLPTLLTTTALVVFRKVSTI